MGLLDFISPIISKTIISSKRLPSKNNLNDRITYKVIITDYAFDYICSVTGQSHKKHPSEVKIHQRNP